MGEGESVATERPFHSMNAVESTRAKLRIWVRNWRGWREERADNIVAVGRERKAGGIRYNEFGGAAIRSINVFVT